MAYIFVLPVTRSASLADIKMENDSKKSELQVNFIIQLGDLKNKVPDRIHAPVSNLQSEF